MVKTQHFHCCNPGSNPGKAKKVFLMNAEWPSSNKEKVAANLD